LLGEKELASIKAPELLAVLRKIEQRGAIETADRALMDCGQVWRYGVATGRVERDMCADLKGALTPYRGKHLGAIIKPNDFAQLLHQLKAYKGTLIVKAALELAPLVFVRPNELRLAEWSEFDLTAALWTIPSQRMKRTKAGKENGVPHIVPLSTQAVKILQALHPFTGNNHYVFRGERDHERPMSDNAVRSALHSLGYSGETMTGHGFRASARTMLDEQLGVNPLVIEAQLAHAVKDANGRAYNRTQYLPQRAAMMQQWADYLDTLTAQPHAAA
jgi:integrase